MLLFSQRSIGFLFVAQALYWSCSLIGIAMTSLVGAQLAPLASLATLPLGLLMLGNLLATQPLSLYMQRTGRRQGLLLGAACGVIGGLLSAWGVWLSSFSLFCLGALPIGIYQASAMYYRFAAQEAVADHQKGRATAYVVGGGVLAAVLAPSLALWSRTLLDASFVGPYLAIAFLALLAIGVVAWLPQGGLPNTASGGWSTLLARRTIRTAMACTAAGHGLMVLIMNSTPLAMHHSGLSLEHSTQVIQWHLLGMFLPAFIAGPLVDYLGARHTAKLGIALLAASAAIALSGQALLQFWASSVLLGMGWNLLLIAGTTLLAQGHSPAERGQAQGLMELINASLATLMSLSAGVLINGLGWSAVNLLVWPILAIALLMLWQRPQAD